METTDYCSYELSKALKAAGFDEPCIAQWACEPDGKPILVGSTAFVFSNAELKGRDVTVPLLYHAQKWLREKKGIAINVIAHGRHDKYREVNIIGRKFICRTAKKMALNGAIGLSTAGIRYSIPTRKRYRTGCCKCWN